MPTLFDPLQAGAFSLPHRVVMAPLTRSRSQQPGDIPGELMLQYYSQRASEGGFIISEATANWSRPEFCGALARVFDHGVKQAADKKVIRAQ